MINNLKLSGAIYFRPWKQLAVGASDLMSDPAATPGSIQLASCMPLAKVLVLPAADS